MTPQSLFQDNLDLIESLCRTVSRRNGFMPADAEDFASHAKIQLMADDYSRLRRFQGRSSFETFLRSVILNLFRDHRDRLWGRWRPSSEARRRGKVAEHLDRLLHRDGRSFDEAVTILRSHFQVPLTLEELEVLAGDLPPHYPRRFEGEGELARLPVENRADDLVADGERQAVALKVREVLRGTMSTFTAEERLVLRMHFEDGVSFAGIARVLQLEQRQVYTRVGKCFRRLKAALDDEGLVRDDVMELLGWSSPDWPGPTAGSLPGVVEKEEGIHAH